MNLWALPQPLTSGTCATAALIRWSKDARCRTCPPLYELPQIPIWSGSTSARKLRPPRRGYPDSVAEALEMDQDTVGPSPSATYMHIPPLFMCEVS